MHKKNIVQLEAKDRKHRKMLKIRRKMGIEYRIKNKNAMKKWIWINKKNQKKNVVVFEPIEIERITKNETKKKKPKNLPFLLSYRLGRPSKDEQKKCKPKTINICMQNKVLFFVLFLFLFHSSFLFAKFCLCHSKCVHEFSYSLFKCLMILHFKVQIFVFSIS